MEISPGALLLIQDVRSRRSVPSSHVLRLYRRDGSNGGTTVRIGFTDRPHDGDEISDVDGVPVYVEEKIAESVADARLDVKASTNGSVTFVLRRPRDQ